MADAANIAPKGRFSTENIREQGREPCEVISFRKAAVSPEKWECQRLQVRSAIRRAKSMSKRDREALNYLVNLWFYYRSTDGYIHPGREKIAARLECGLRTVARCLDTLRDGGFIIPVKYGKGGRNSTRYVVDLSAIMRTFAPARNEVEAMFQAEFDAESGAAINRAKTKLNRANLAHGIIQRSLKTVRENFGDDSDWSEVPF